MQIPFKHRYLPISVVLSCQKNKIIQHPGKQATMYLCLLLLMQSGDCETNPGPSNNDSSSIFPCILCGDPCTWSQRAVQCDECNGWYHAHCMDMNSSMYEALGGSNVSWICCNCGLPNVSTSFLSQWSINLSNSFASLETLDSDNVALSPPITSSSPKAATGRSKKCSKTKKTSNKGRNPTKPNFSRPLKVLVINFGSIKNKVADLAACLEFNNPDIVLGSETWLNPSIRNEEIFPNKYTVVRKDRIDSHGGVLVAFKSDLVGTHRMDLDTDCEVVWVQIQLVGCKSLLVGAFYRPPDKRENQYLNELQTSLSRIKGKHNDNIWIGGDFNLGDIQWDSQNVRPNPQVTKVCHQMIDLANDHNLQQIVTDPTRQSNILDLFFTNNPTLVEKSTILPGISDHDGIPMLVINTSPKISKSKPRRVYLYAKADKTGMKTELNNFGEEFCATISNTESVEHLWNVFKTRLKNIMDNFIPTKVISKQNKTPWITPKIKRMHRRKQRAYNKARNSGNDCDWESFREIRKETHKLTRSAYRKHIREYCLESKKQFWSFVKSLRKDSSGVPALKEKGILTSEDRQKAEILNEYFRSVFTTENLQTLPNLPQSNILGIDNIIIHTPGIEKLLKNLDPKKASGVDEISPRILKEFSQELAPLLSKIFQASLDTGNLPEDWRKANITPIHKKGDRTKPENYRPISLTSVCCKLLEHVVHSHIMNHLESYNVLSKYQHGFRKGHSCESQLIQTMHDLTLSLDKRTQTDMIVTDFSKAFDTVPHHRLILKLNQYGINGKTNRWISSFLQDRHQRVVLGGEHSQWVRVKSGVPQGTVLGPLLFLIYVNDIPDELSSTVRLYADDCILYSGIKTQLDATRLQDDLDRLSAWVDKWQMQLNPQKCHVLRFNASRSPVITKYTIGGTVLQETPSHSYLGVEISNDLKWDKHISNITSSANKVNGFIRRNLISCTKQTKSLAYTTLVRPIVEYSSSVWDPYTKEHTQEIGKVQRRAARMVCNDYRQTTSATKLMVGLGWDLLSIRRKVSRVCILHKALGGGGGTWPCRCRTTCVQLHEPPDVPQETPSSNTPPAPIVLNTPTFHVPSRTGTHYPPTSKGPRTSTPSNSKQPTFSATKTQAIRTKQAQCAPPHPPRLVPYGTLRSILNSV